MAVVENQIACDNWLYTNNLTTLAGSNSYACPPKSVITGTYNLAVSGTYADNQLVKQSDISLGVTEVPFYVVFNWHTVPYSSRWVYYQGRQVMPVYCNVKTDIGISVDHGPGNNVKNGSNVLMSDNTRYDVYMDTSINSAGAFQALPCDSSNGTKEYCMNMNTQNYGSPSFNHFAIPAGSKIRGINMKGVYVTFYDSSNNSIGTSGSVTTNFAYSLSIGVNQWGYWQPASYYWRDQYGSTVTRSMVGYSDRYELDCSTDLDSRFTLDTTTLSGSNRGIAIMFDFHDLYSGSGDSNSSW